MQHVGQRADRFHHQSNKDSSNADPNVLLSHVDGHIYGPTTSINWYAVIESELLNELTAVTAPTKAFKEVE